MSSCRYAKSRSDTQLRGATATSSSLASDCEPELFLNTTDSTGQISPCGLVAWSFFNDSFSVCSLLSLASWSCPRHRVQGRCNPSRQTLRAGLSCSPHPCALHAFVADIDENGIQAIPSGEHLVQVTVLNARPRGFQVDVQMGTTAPATALTIDETGIAWQSDIKKKFGDQQVANFNDVPALRGGGTVTGDGRNSNM